MSDPRHMLYGWTGHFCDPRSPSGGGGPGQFRWAGSLHDAFVDEADLLHPWAPMCRADPCILGMGPSKTAQNTAVPWADYAADFNRWEGRIPHMYLDTKGLVTVGVGKMLPDAAAAKKLAFVRRADAVAATEAEIQKDFDEVAKQTKGQLAGNYKQYTKLDLPDTVIDELLKTVANGFEADLKAEFSGYDTYPAPAKRALMDMIYNLGKGGLLKFKSLKKACEGGNWKEAAAQSHRIGPSQERNDWTRDLFLKAAE